MNVNSVSNYSQPHKTNFKGLVRISDPKRASEALELAQKFIPSLKSHHEDPGLFDIPTRFVNMLLEKFNKNGILYTHAELHPKSPTNPFKAWF